MYLNSIYLNKQRKRKKQRKKENKEKQVFRKVK